jgi:hypothetical protein
VLTVPNEGHIQFDTGMRKVSLVDDASKATIFTPHANEDNWELLEKGTNKILLVYGGNKNLRLYENLPKLSEQQLVSCASDWNNGCSGGNEN